MPKYGEKRAAHIQKMCFLASAPRKQKSAEADDAKQVPPKAGK
ncbi:hypothetical protein JM93_01788 [Roseibium hamelinense]|uniref:Uncharacterized protein n=1 Tax=Roseibium hamelinense TaxID=150831 RepID=A0A562T8M4_9HYPH|nr:hypothetical protein JM93_01788 [Roseibium hamelinense]